MNIKRFLISEVEKKDILKQYGLINEQVTTQTTTQNVKPTNTLELDVVINFNGGMWSESSANFAQSLDPKLDEITKKLAVGKFFLVSVDISSGESRIPNTNGEANKMTVSGCTDVPLTISGVTFKTIPEKCLAKQRGVTIQSYITKKLQTYVSNKLLISLPNFNIKEPIIGGPNWVGQTFCPAKDLVSGDTQGFTCLLPNFKPSTNVTNWTKGKESNYSGVAERYRTAQFLRVKLKLEEMTEIKSCLDNMKIQVNYTDTSKEHRCNSSVYRIKVNGFTLTRDGDGKDYASLNNAGDQYDNKPDGTCKNAKDAACIRTNSFTVGSDLASKILTASMSKLKPGNTPKFAISATCLNPNNYSSWSGGCHKGVGNIVVINGKGTKYSYDSSTPEKKDEVKVLVRIDACGSGTVE